MYVVFQSDKNYQLKLVLLLEIDSIAHKDLHPITHDKVREPE